MKMTPRRRSGGMERTPGAAILPPKGKDEAMVKQRTTRHLEPPRRYPANSEGVIALYAALARKSAAAEADARLRAKFAASQARRKPI